MTDSPTPAEVVVTDQPQEAPPKTFTQDEVNRLMGRTRDEGRAEVLKKLGIDSPDEAAKLIAEAQQLKADQMTASEKLTAELEAAKKAAEEAARALAARELADKKREIALAVAKEKGIAIETATELASRLSGADEDAIKADAEALFAALPKATPSRVPSAVDDFAPESEVTRKEYEAAIKAGDIPRAVALKQKMFHSTTE